MFYFLFFSQMIKSDDGKAESSSSSSSSPPVKRFASSRQHLQSLLHKISDNIEFTCGGVANELPNTDIGLQLFTTTACSEGQDDVDAVENLKAKGDRTRKNKKKLSANSVTMHNLSLPLNAESIQLLTSECEEAPFGKGLSTVLDQSVRSTLQLDVSKFQVTNKNWDHGIQKLAQRAAKLLGINDGVKVHAKPYKLLLYRENDFFKPHQDTEKDEGMFGSMIVQLPSLYVGGHLVVTHNGVTKTHDFGASSSSASTQYCHFAAHYCNVQHEVLPVQVGHRLVIAYNLCWSNPPNHQQMSTGSSLQHHTFITADMELNRDMVDIVKHYWSSDVCDGEFDHRAIVAIPLEHEYTDSSLTTRGFQCFKGHDLNMVDKFKYINTLIEPFESRLAMYCLGVTRETSSS
jgi:hypothetical protein